MIWAPRILAIFFILFLALFSLDSASPMEYFLHNLPSLFLTVILIISWRYEIVGGITFILAGLTYIIMLATSSNLEWYMLSWSIIITGTAWVIGFLFLKNWQIKRQGS